VGISSCNPRKKGNSNQPGSSVIRNQATVKERTPQDDDFGFEVEVEHYGKKLEKYYFYNEAPNVEPKLVDF